MATNPVIDPWVDPEGLSEDASTALTELVDLTPKYFDPGNAQERSAIGVRIASRFFTLFTNIAVRLCDAQKPDARYRALVRAGAPVPEHLSAPMAEIVDNVGAAKLLRRDEATIFYLDEWLGAIYRQELAPSTSDESAAASPTAKKGAGSKEKLLKADTDRTAAKARLIQALTTSGDSDKLLADLAVTFRDLGLQRRGLFSAEKTITDATRGAGDAVVKRRRQLLLDIRNSLEWLLGSENEIVESFRAFDLLDVEVRKLKRLCLEEGEGLAADTGSVNTELNTVRQMMKMAIGPRGNHFPILTQSHLRGVPGQMVNTRETIQAQLDEYEKMDPGLFMRTSHGQEVRVVPLIVILPCVGNTGICWQPWHSGNRRTPGRLGIPLFSAKNDNDMVLRALASFKWLVAMETAMHYWMEEGLTGAYYNHKESERGRLEDQFASDYTLWMTKEANGRAILDPKTRALLWRYCPFGDDIKAKLKDLGAFRQLLEADSRRSKSRFTSM